ncbi:MAG: 16S rRNA (cytosine(1402)-N(4))-methyltransferase RsmH [Gammaproteobacteria bacterium]|jgi:16S rRNA (cytosine1402-N4)-methyltransferase|nr:16S rRNA (cytosine(1402)-N(4))-methyltransferase RsmH [Gammaproteobacteria bacterium]MBT6074604.1 16S rRNA (cytosine(1402)-N(4))-methyltransferase RsmH [Gammaproteobacteria bacterium]MBT7753892.1 16S rRNA (cytosine(1402)-N(4))-methyltransferase RsmH [Gammaproteobacteria bacterium]
MSNIIHEPVLLEESLTNLIDNYSGNYLDVTAGFGGHSSGILDIISHEGRLISSDRDQDSINYLNNRFSENPNINIIKSNFSQICQALKKENIEFKFDGIIADLGMSSFQLDNSERGFSFMRNGKLDMRMDQQQNLIAKDWINTAPENEIANVIWRFGEESSSRKIAKEIVKKRKKKLIETTEELAEIITDVKKNTAYKNKKHPATKTFQGIRIFINNELEELKLFLDNSLELLNPKGRLCIISFHSLEDRIVKRFFRDNSRIDPNLAKLPNMQDTSMLKVIAKKIKPTESEIIHNPRARSAVLRVAERTSLL